VKFTPIEEFCKAEKGQKIAEMLVPTSLVEYVGGFGNIRVDDDEGVVSVTGKPRDRRFRWETAAFELALHTADEELGFYEGLDSDRVLFFDLWLQDIKKGRIRKKERAKDVVRRKRPRKPFPGEVFHAFPADVGQNLMRNLITTAQNVLGYDYLATEPLHYHTYRQDLFFGFQINKWHIRVFA